MGGANSNFQILIWAFQTVFRRRKQPSSPGRARRQPPPPFSYKKAKWGCSKGPWSPWWCITVVFGEKNCFREENPSRGASLMLPRCFRKQIREGFPPFLTVLHPFFVLQWVSFQIWDFQFISIFLAFIFISFTFGFFSSVFNELWPIA